MWRYLFFIILFIIVVSDVTKNELKRIFWILHPEVRGVIAARAAFAKFFLLPGMKKANKIQNGWYSV